MEIGGHIVCLGEVLLRLTAPGHELLLQSGTLNAHIGGAEANVAVALASLGLASRMATVLPDNPLGKAALNFLRAHGVDCSGVKLAGGRMGLYFVSPAAGHRPAAITYDREGSAFAHASMGSLDWDRILDGAGLLHLSGINLPLGSGTADLAFAAVEAAAEHGIPVSFDCNFRQKLWERSRLDPAEPMMRIVRHCDILFGNYRDIGLLLGQGFECGGVPQHRTAEESAFAAFPNLRLIASTERQVESTQVHRLSARIATPTESHQTPEQLLTGIVDRIGGGDAFAAGILYGLQSRLTPAEIAETGLALACLKHSLPGDACLLGREDLSRFGKGEFDVQR